MRRNVVVLLTSLLAGCQGGGNWYTPDTFYGSPANSTPSNPDTGSPVTGSAEGAYTGTLSVTPGTSSQNPATTASADQMLGLVLDTGTVYFLYYSSDNGTPSVGGIITGTSNAMNGNFSSTDARALDFTNTSTTGAIGSTGASVTGSYVPQQSLNGSISYQNSSSATFTSTYNPRYELQPSVASLAGSYAGSGGEVGASGTATITVSDQGVITGQISSPNISNPAVTTQCNFTGAATPHATGNVYDLSITFGGTGCINGTNTANGVVFLDANNQFYMAALNSDQSNGLLFIGAK